MSKEVEITRDKVVIALCDMYGYSPRQDFDGMTLAEIWEWCTDLQQAEVIGYIL